MSPSLVTLKGVKEASHYFGMLADDCISRLSVKVEDKKKVEVAYFAAGILKPIKLSKEKIDELRGKGAYINDQPYLAEKIESVIEMQANYDSGKKEFGRDTLEGASDVCRTLADLVSTGEIKL